MTGLRSLVFVAYSFPPVSTGSAPRCIALSRCLPEGGWRMVPVSASNPAGMPVDPTLLDRLPEEVRNSAVRISDPLARISGPVARPLVPGGRRRMPSPVKLLRSFLRLYVMIPDKTVVWARKAAAAAAEAAVREKASLIMSFGPPHTCHLAAMKAAHRTGLPWIAHFGDLWLYDSLNEWQYVSAFSKRRQARMEAKVVLDADGIFTTSEGSSEYFRRTYGDACPPLFHLANGYDPFLQGPAGDPSPGRGDRLTLTYTGFFMGTQTPEPFLRGMRLYLDRRPGSRLFLRIVGEIRAQHAGLPGALGLEDRVEVTGKVSYQEALTAQGKADALLAMIPPLPGSEVKSPSKLAEYLLARRPILAVAQSGDLTRTVRALDAGYVADPAPEAIAETLERMEDDWLAGTLKVARDMQAVASIFDMRLGCRRLGAYLDGIVAHRAENALTIPGP